MSTSSISERTTPFSVSEDEIREELADAGPVTASDLAIRLLRRHPEYGADLFEGATIDPAAGPQTEVDDWLAAVKTVYDMEEVDRTDQVLSDGWLTLAGLAELDPALEAALGPELLGTIRNEVAVWPQVGLEWRLGALLDSYRSAMKFVEELPLVRRWPVQAQSLFRDFGSMFRVRSSSAVRLKHRKLKHKKRWVIRPLARLYVEGHVRKQLLRLIRLLRIEAFTRTDDDSELIKEQIARLEEAESGLFGWGRLRSALSGAPVFTTAVATAIAIYQVTSGIDLSSGADLGRTVAESAQAEGWGPVLDLLRTLFYLAVAAYVLVISPAVMLGFKRKRAIFLGGVTPDKDEAVLFFLRGPTLWQNFPKEDVYRRENRVFDLLSGRKNEEQPLDLWLSVFPYYWLWGSVLLVLEATRDGGWSGAAWAIFLYGSTTVWMIAPRVKIASDRRRTRNR